VFNNVNALGVALTESVAGAGTVAGAQVNVALAATLAGALDLAATFVAPQGAGTGIAASTGKIDWFQFGGNTWVVEAINGGAAAADHHALGAGDAVVELLGLVNLNGGAFAGHTLTI